MVQGNGDEGFGFEFSRCGERECGFHSRYKVARRTFQYRRRRGRNASGVGRSFRPGFSDTFSFYRRLATSPEKNLDRKKRISTATLCRHAYSSHESLSGTFPAAWDASVFAGMTVFDSLRYDLIP